MEQTVCILWFPIVWALFKTNKPNIALLLTILIGQLFLPIIQLKIIEGFVLFYKSTLIGFSLALIAPLMIPNQILTWRPKLVDFPMFTWCLVPLFTSVTNDLGLPDGFSTVISRTLDWGVPYFLGRMVLNDSEDVNNVEKYLFLGGLIYVPLCLLEMKISPQLHNIVYGHHATGHSFSQSLRLGGYRPTVFMQHGLAVGFWMMAASFAACTHLFLQDKKNKLSKSFKLSAYSIIITFLLCKSTGAYALFALCMICIYIGVKYRSKILLKCLMVIPLIFIYLRSSRLWLGENLAAISSSLFGAERAQSLAFRIANENILTLHAWKKPLLGWGGWGRAQAIDPETLKPIIFDSLWGVSFGVNGFIGLTSITLAVILPVILATKKFPPKNWSNPINSGVVTILFVSLAYSLDNLFNNMPNQYILLGLGALTSKALQPIRFKDEFETREKLELSYT